MVSEILGLPIFVQKHYAIVLYKLTLSAKFTRTSLKSNIILTTHILNHHKIVSPLAKEIGLSVVRLSGVRVKFINYTDYFNSVGHLFMARLARVSPLGVPQHIIQRGNNRQVKLQIHPF